MFGSTFVRCHEKKQKVSVAANHLFRFDINRLPSYLPDHSDENYKFELRLENEKVGCSIQIFTRSPDLEKTEVFQTVQFSTYNQINGADKGQNARLFSSNQNQRNVSLGIYCHSNSSDWFPKPITLEEIQELTQGVLTISSQ